MIPRAEMHVCRLPASGVNLIGTLKALAAAKKGNRIPVLDDKDHPAYVIHRSTIDRYLVQKAASPGAPDLATLTLENLLADDPETKGLLESSKRAS